MSEAVLRKPQHDHYRVVEIAAEQVLADCALSFGEPLPAAYGIPGNPRAVRAAAWRDELFRRGVLDRVAKNPREDFARVKRALMGRQLAGERDGLVWAVSA